jgi:hypothetical protein
MTHCPDASSLTPQAGDDKAQTAAFAVYRVALSVRNNAAKTFDRAARPLKKRVRETIRYERSVNEF